MKFNKKEDVEQEVMEPEVLETEATPVKAEKEMFVLDNGAEGSRSAFIRQEFKKDRSRNEIAKELDVKYHIVYSATTNMFNSHHPEEGSGQSSRGAQVAKINSDMKFVDAEGNVVESPEEAAVASRADIMRDLFGQGITRSALKDYFSVPYATVYAATKDVEAPEGTVRGGKKMVAHPETGELVSRTEYIRELYQDGEGMTRKDIARHLTSITGDLVDYTTVWAATAKKKVVEPVEAPEEIVED